MNKKFFAAAATFTFTFGITAPAIAADPVKFKNCSALYKEYPGGIAKNGAVDMTKKKGKLVPASPKKSPFVDDAWYAKNYKLDKDKDGVACEK